MQKEIDHCLRPQAGFRSGRSCNEYIFTLRNIIEQSLEFNHALIINYVDFKKAFDSVHRPSLWKVLVKYGVPDRYISIFKSLYNDLMCCVKTETGFTDFFRVIYGVQ